MKTFKHWFIKAVTFAHIIISDLLRQHNNNNTSTKHILHFLRKAIGWTDLRCGSSSKLHPTWNWSMCRVQCTNKLKRSQQVVWWVWLCIRLEVSRKALRYLQTSKIVFLRNVGMTLGNTQCSQSSPAQAFLKKIMVWLGLIIHNWLL